MSKSQYIQLIILSTGRLESLQPFNVSVRPSQLKGFQNFEK